MSQRVTYFFFHSLFRDFPLRFRSTPWGRRTLTSTGPQPGLASQRLPAPHTSPPLPHKHLSFLGGSIPPNQSPLLLWGTGNGGALPKGPLSLPAGGSCPFLSRPGPQSWIQAKELPQDCSSVGFTFLLTGQSCRGSPLPRPEKGRCRGTPMFSPDTSRRPCGDVPHPVSFHPRPPCQHELAKAMPVICHPRTERGSGKAARGSTE